MSALYRTELSAEDLWEAFEYKPLTGVFIRRSAGITRPDRIGKSANSVNKSLGYEQVYLKGYLVYGHIATWCWVTGEWPPEGLEVDHRNQVRHDNTWNNLRLVTRGQNQANRATQINNKLGVKGVAVRKSGKYVSCVQTGGTRHHLGTFDTIEEASAAYQKAALEIHGEFACLT